MSTKTKTILAVVVILTAFAGGRWSAPTKVVTETKTVEVERKATQQDKNISRDRQRVTTITEITHADGTKETITKITEGTKTDVSSQTSTQEENKKNQETLKEVTRSSSRLSLSALGGIDFHDRTTVYGAHVSRELLGPISMGVWGLSSGVGGVSLGLSF